ncbi:hypothetical protein RBSWK_03748 [Rhodopirellula baltica SWK14]|uniref:Uncharacterized protein n=1 Tax=Rhodopirellula baltica SWK14 TaxID=993516 RepID=L7CE73_RHOBT|nr:hypothetical protein RBSWK_03748 [Rhodopirellula baltica SWK14]
MNNLAPMLSLFPPRSTTMRQNRKVGRSSDNQNRCRKPDTS